jgi:hypothetical protein
MSIEFLKTFEKRIIRPVSYIIFPRPLRHFYLSLKMKVVIHFKPVKYNFYRGDIVLKNRLCIFVSFQKNGIQRTTWKYLKHLKEELEYGVVLISNCRLQERDISQLQGLCVEVIERDNIGYDFGAYKDGIIRYMNNLDSLDTLLIANDSVIGPIYHMKDMHNKMQNEDCDFWGISDYSEIPENQLKIDAKYFPHVSSYFICFKKAAIQNKFFKDYWKKLSYPNERKIALRHEKKLGQYLLNNKFKYSVFIKKEDIINFMYENKKVMDFDLFFSNKAMKALERQNQYSYVSNSHTNESCPMLTLTHFKMPLMKRNLFRENIVDINVFKAILNKFQSQLTEIISKEEIIDEMGLDPRTQNSIYKWDRYVI